MRFARRRMRRGRRRTSWIPGWNLWNDNEQSSLSAPFTTDAGNNGQGVLTLELAAAADLNKAGGEGAVLARVVGEMLLYGLERDGTPVNGSLRWAICIAENDATGGVMLPAFWSSAGLGSEDILAMGQVLAAETDLFASASDVHDLGAVDWVVVDTSVRRRMDDNRRCYFVVSIAPDVQASGSMRVRASGYLRMLLQHASLRR